MNFTSTSASSTETPWYKLARRYRDRAKGVFVNKPTIPRFQASIKNLFVTASSPPRNVEGHVHAAPDPRLPGEPGGIKAVRGLDNVVDQLALRDRSFFHFLESSFPGDPVHHDAHDVYVEGGDGVPDVPGTDVRGVVEEPGAPGVRQVQEIVADHDDGHTGMADVFRRAGKDDTDVRFAPGDGLRTKIRTGVDDPRDLQFRQTVEIDAID
eukprot:CAMPEP_0201128862 /NCGR_PEP_ID=MMETSP0850-20130426/35066_1 /ASSEMBLY_ACC=CAM_ASM_000622 /TAXON_ID=183588 /ORGANISM="Pseudo-nitzschia fraudulenta, Strain WWA7" /LENGTH=209 /DNA_ID=CAMNT_0047398179 /DNA_START=428 /DNA_END=1053 /DNA_ORIENTATION=+